MIKYLTTLISLFCIAITGLTQLTSTEIEQHRNKHLTTLTDTAYHRLNLEEINGFGGLDYYPFNTDYQLDVTFSKDKGKWFEMPTSTDRKPQYRRYGHVHFMIDSAQYQLTIYQQKEYKEFLFIPFRDLTSKTKTYGGGRYLDFPKVKPGPEKLDFNLAYNPYCAYSYRYSCPIPPSENTLKITIEAGEKKPFAH